MRLRTPRAPVGVRLAAVTALLVLAVGGVLLAASWWLLVVRLPESFVLATPLGAQTVEVAGSTAFGSTGVDTTAAACPQDRTDPGGAVVVCVEVPQTSAPEVGSADSSAGSSAGASSATAPVAGEAVGIAPTEVNAFVVSAAQDTAEQFTSTVRRQFAAQSAGLLGVLTVMAVAVGWFAARRALRPVHAMTETAHRLGAQSLGERLPVTGPRDELSDLAETFNAMLDRVEDAFGRERRLMANVSHELRTPLANQRIALEVGLEDPAADAAELRRLAEQALAQNRRAEHLITELLVLARAEQSQDCEEDGEVTDLADAARQAAQSVRSVPDAVPGLDVRLDLAPAPVSARPALVERLVGNLVENAVRHNVDGGFVHVATQASDGAAQVVVENSGPVVPADAVPGLVEPFRRGASGAGDRVRSDRGVGLGLSIVAAVVARYAGRLDAQPRPDGGLRVTVTLPTPP